MLKILQARLQEYVIFQMFKLDLEKAELPEIKLPNFVGSSKKQESSRETSAVPWSPRRSNQSILKEISPGYSLERLMLKLKLQYFGHLIQRTDSLEKTLILGKSEDGRRREQQRMSWLDGIINSMDMGLRKLQELVCIDRWPMPLLLFIHWQMLFTSAKL